MLYLLFFICILVLITYAVKNKDNYRPHRPNRKRQRPYRPYSDVNRQTQRGNQPTTMMEASYANDSPPTYSEESYHVLPLYS